MLFWTDLNELKAVLQIPVGNRNEDASLLFFVNYAQSIIEEFLGHEIEYRSRTEYYNGTGTQYLPLRCRPVFTSPTVQVWVDDNGNWGSTSGAFTNSNSELTYGTDFSLKIDQRGGSSRSGLLVRLHKLWNRPAVRQAGYLSPFIGPANGNIKVIYTAGYSTDTLPERFRAAAALLVARLRYIFPLGLELTGESYEERNISVGGQEKDYMKSLIRPILFTFRNWKW